VSEYVFEPWWVVAILPEILLVVLAIAILIFDLILPVESRRNLGWVTAGGLGLILILGLIFSRPESSPNI